MILARFLVGTDGTIQGFHVTGHAGMDESGKDVLCAFVSSAAYMTANTITEVIAARAEARAEDGEMYVRVSEEDAVKCSDVLKGFRLHLRQTEEQYPECLKVIDTEV